MDSLGRRQGPLGREGSLVTYLVCIFSVSIWHLGHQRSKGGQRRGGLCCHAGGLKEAVSGTVLVWT